MCLVLVKREGVAVSNVDDPIKELKKEDAKLVEKEDRTEGDTRKQLELLMERHRLYYRYETKATNEVVKSQISNMRAEIFTHVIIFKLKADFEDDIAKTSF